MGAPSPSPASAALDAPGRSNPVWSPVQGSEPWQPPASALGMRRLGDGGPTSTVPTWGGDGVGATPAVTAWGGDPDPGSPDRNAEQSEEQLDPEVAGFAAVLHGVMRGEIDASQAPLEYAAVCDRRASELRALAGAALSRPATRAALLRSAAALQGEASTWRLLWHLHGVREADFPGSTGGGFVPGAGRAKTLRQRVADLLALDPELNRAARAVAWLEDGAGRELDAAAARRDAVDGMHTSGVDDGTADADVDAAAAFGPGDGVWRETRRRLEAAKLGVPFRATGEAAAAIAATTALGPGREGELVTELDPDAPSRQAPRTLDADNATDEKRLLRAVWRRLRAGRVAAAAELCRRVGQPWRARALLGGGARGAVPVGREAYADDEAGDLARVESVAAQALAAEAEEEAGAGGAGARRAAWRLACVEAARAPGVGPAEAAVFGVLGCDLDAMLPACDTWQDGVWAGLRAWLDAAVDFQLDLAGAGQGDDGDDGEEEDDDDQDDGMNDDSEDERDVDASVDDSGFPASSASISGDGSDAELMDAEDDDDNKAAGARRSRRSSATRPPTSAAQFGEALVLLGLLGGGERPRKDDAARPGSAAPRPGLFGRGLEWPPAELRAAMPATLSEAMRSAARAGEAAARAGGEDEDVAERQAGEPTADAVARFRQVQVDLVLDRIDALVLHRLRDWALQEERGSGGLVTSPRLLRFAAHLALSLWDLGVATPEAGGEAAFDATQDALHRLLQFYAARLIDGGAGRLAPMYACHLRAGLRRLTLGVQWEGLTLGSVAGCRAGYDAAIAALGAWEGRGDVVPGEAQAAAVRLAAAARAGVAGGPCARAAAQRWLAFHADTHAVLLRELAGLARELALGGAPGRAAGDYLLNELMPEALGCELEAWLAGMAAGGAADAGDQHEQQAEGPAPAQLCAEVAMWATYFELQAAFDEWQAAYAGMRESSALSSLPSSFRGDSNDTKGARRELAQRGLPLLHALSLFLADGCLDLLLGPEAGQQLLPNPWEAAVVVAPLPAAGDDGAADEYPAFAGAGASGAAAAGLRAALTAGPGLGAERVGWAAGPAPTGMPGMVSLAAESVDPCAAREAAAQLALALKGALKLPGSQQRPGLMVVSMDAPATFTGMLCHTVCLPQAVLRAAALREALAFLGHTGAEGADMLQLAAFGHPECFTATEAAELLAFERGATVLHMRRQEQERLSA